MAVWNKFIRVFVYSFRRNESIYIISELGRQSDEREIMELRESVFTILDLTIGICV